MKREPCYAQGSFLSCSPGIRVATVLTIVMAQNVLASHIALQSRMANGVRIYVVIANLNEPVVSVRPVLAAGFDSASGTYTNESFAGMVRRAKPVAAINGTFFDKHTFKPVGSIVIDGKLVHDGDRGTAVCFLDEGRVDFRLVSGTLGSRLDWTGCRMVLCCGPTLLIGNQMRLHPRAEGFRDPHLYMRMNRSALGTTKPGKLVLVTTRTGVTLHQLATIMKSLGAVNAINLDGGASSALYYRGRIVTAPGRKLTNILCVYEARE